MKKQIVVLALLGVCLFAIFGCLQNVAPPNPQTVKLIVPNLLGG